DLRRHGGLWVVLGVSLLFVALVIWGFETWRRNTPAAESLPTDINLAVLPFSVTGADANRQFFSQGLGETLTMQLSRLTANRPFQVATVADVRARNVRTPQEAREQLGTNVVLTGTLQYSAGSIQITCTLIDTRSGRELRRISVPAEATDVLDAERRVAEA